MNQQGFWLAIFFLMLFYEGEGIDENAESIDFGFGRYIRGATLTVQDSSARVET